MVPTKLAFSAASWQNSSYLYCNKTIAGAWRILKICGLEKKTNSQIINNDIFSVLLVISSTERKKELMLK
jgi:hypothetical protein